MNHVECMLAGLKPFIPSIHIMGATSRAVSTHPNSVHIRYEFGAGEPNKCFVIGWNKRGFTLNGKPKSHAGEIMNHIYDIVQA